MFFFWFAFSVRYRRFMVTAASVPSHPFPSQPGSNWRFRVSRWQNDRETHNCNLEKIQPRWGKDGSKQCVVFQNWNTIRTLTGIFSTVGHAALFQWMSVSVASTDKSIAHFFQVLGSHATRSACLLDASRTGDRRLVFHMFFSGPSCHEVYFHRSVDRMNPLLI